MIDPSEFRFTQVDSTESFQQDTSLERDQWIVTIPLSKLVGENYPGLPPAGASAGEIYALAAELSEIRVNFRIPGDGVYCPICHIANVDIERLLTPCPQCGRDLLSFGWT